MKTLIMIRDKLRIRVPNYVLDLLLKHAHILVDEVY